MSDDDMGLYIKKEFGTADLDQDRQLTTAEFMPWYDKFIRYVEDCRAESESRLAAKKGITKPGVAAAPGPAEPDFSSDMMWECPMPKLERALEAAWKKKKTPLLIDFSDPKRESASFSPLETFFGYSGYELLEMKKMVVEVNVTKVASLDDHLENNRKKLVSSMKYGKPLAIMLVIIACRGCACARTCVESRNSSPVEAR